MADENDPRYRVAYDLAMQIAKAEAQLTATDQNREYWLKLYHECFNTVKGGVMKISDKALESLK